MRKYIWWGILFLAVYLVFYPQSNQFADSTIQKMNLIRLHKNIQLQYPSTMQVVENWVRDRDQLQFSATMNDEQSGLRGYIQVWHLQNIDDFLHRSKEMSTFDFYTYSLNTVQIGELQGVLNIWGASFGESTRISGKEYWLNTPNQQVLRIAFLTNETQFSEEQLKIMSYMLSSLQWVMDNEKGQNSILRSGVNVKKDETSNCLDWIDSLDVFPTGWMWANSTGYS